MAAPTVRAVSALATGTTSVTPTMPTVVAGDVILVIGECANGLPATPSGYTLLFSRNQLDEAGVDTNLAIYAKLAAGGDGNPTLTGGSMANHGIFGIITVQDHGVSDVATDIVVGSGSGDATAGAGKTCASITVTADSLIVACFGDSADQLTSVWSNAANANLTGITTRLDGNTNTGNGGGAFVYTGACAGTTTGTSAADLAATTRDGWNSAQIGIPPAGAAAIERAASLDGIATIVATQQRDVMRAVSLDGVVDIASAPNRELFRAASGDATATITVSGARVADRATTLDGIAAITSSAQRDVLRQTTLDALADVIAAGGVVGGAATLERAASIDAQADVIAQAQRDLLRQGSFDALATIIAAGGGLVPGAADAVKAPTSASRITDKTSAEARTGGVLAELATDQNAAEAATRGVLIGADTSRNSATEG